MSRHPSGVRIAQTIGITAAGFVAGTAISCSFLTIPAILKAPFPTIAIQWQKIYDIGKIASPAISLISAAAYAFAALKLKGTLDQNKAEVYGLCAILEICMLPFTIFVLGPTNNQLFLKAEEALAAGSLESGATIREINTSNGQSTHQLVDSWSTRNFIRGLLPLTATILGTWVTLA